jgi:putative FmdB family regulatory protein
MPLYDYHCPDCGGFRAWRSMTEARDPTDCPSCNRPALRAMVAPNLALMAPNRRVAHQRNEKSANEPRVVSTSEPHQNNAAGHAHHRHHGHGHGHKHAVGSRPWMIGH